MSNVTEAFHQVIEQGVEAGLAGALNVSEVANRRMLSIEKDSV